MITLRNRLLAVAMVIGVLLAPRPAAASMPREIVQPQLTQTIAAPVLPPAPTTPGSVLVSIAPDGSWQVDFCRNDPVNVTDPTGLAGTTLTYAESPLPGDAPGRANALSEPDIDAAYKDYNALGAYSDPYGPWLKASCEWRETCMEFSAVGATKSMARLPKDLVLLVPNLGRAGWMVVTGEGDQLLAGIKRGAGDWWGRFTSGDPRVSGEAAGSAFGEVSKAAVLGNVIAKVRGVPNGNQSLVHLTDDAGATGISKTSVIMGKRGIFAVPARVAAESAGSKMLRTGLSKGKTVNAVPIPAAASSQFLRPIPIGPYSAWKYLGGVRYAAPGSISTTTGGFSPMNAVVGPGTLIYGPDAILYGGLQVNSSLQTYIEGE